MTWTASRIVAQRMGKDITAIEKAAKAGRMAYRYVRGRGRGGRVMQVDVDSLPPKLLSLYNGVISEQPDILSFPAKQREAADYRAFIVEEYWRSGLSPADYVANYNQTNPTDPLNTDRLFRWQRKYKASGKSVSALVDRRGGHNRGQSSIPPDAWDYFYSMYMTLQKRTVQFCYNKTKNKYPGIPSVSAFERRVRALPLLVKIHYREGKRAAKNKYPHMTRDFYSIDSNDIWYSDEYTMDCFAKDETGTPTRYSLLMWLDARSRLPVAWALQPRAATTDTIKRTLRQGIEQYGVPSRLYIDNGNIYKSKDGLSRDFPLSLVNRLGIKTTYARPYSPEGKAAQERIFGTISSQFCRQWLTYCGSDNINRPEYLQRPISHPKEYLEKHSPIKEEFITAFAAWIDEYITTAHSGQAMEGKPPIQVYTENLKSRRVVSDHEALRLLCGRVETRIVQRNGIQIFNNEYFNDALPMHLGETVTVIYDPDNLNELNIFDIHGRAICVAQPRILMSFNPTAEEYREGQREKKNVRKALRDHQPLHDLTVQEIMARQHRQKQDYDRTGEVPTAEVYNNMLQESRKLADMKKNSAGQAGMDNEAQQLQDDLLDYYTKGGKKDVAGSA
ncbi:Mu transposase C-terminal domain-containing protein [Ruminococcaceae bacterium OttesenSCG-928-A11]|nr:Mu transposase C-terminal domain-containing protein [Ruminococcaceae bacterium OttesenSCG-928-A11]